MLLKAQKTNLPEILYLRELFLQENNFQIRYNSCHERGWSDSYILSIDDVNIGYGSVKGKENLSDRDAIFEFYIVPSYRRYSAAIFKELIVVSKATYMECQSNDPLLSAMLYEFSRNINSDVILFEDDRVTNHIIPGVIFRKRNENDTMFEDNSEPDGDYVLESGGEIVATGGFMLHYNIPFADLYMKVRSDQRQQGLGCLLIQELIRECYLSGRVPAARCDLTNLASKATLLKGGLRVAGYLLCGEIKS